MSHEEESIARSHLGAHSNATDLTKKCPSNSKELSVSTSSAKRIRVGVDTEG